MLISLKWLNDYVEVPTDVSELEDRFSMSGLNHESTEQTNGDTVLDLEVTSNRGDCLSHIGVAREVAALYGADLKIPKLTSDRSQSESPVEGESAADLVTVRNEFTDGCPRYTARVVRGVKVGPSPDWLIAKLKSIGIESVSNVVDITNFVMFECGQPLHAFDLSKINDGTIVIRKGDKSEKFTAIDHREYELDPQTIVIADSQKAVAMAGVMGGADSEVSEATTDVLIEAADFAPLLVRRTARKQKLHSPASYRFERRIDRGGVDWAAIRCCEMIVEVCGGEFVPGSVEDGVDTPPQPEINLRNSQVSRILGIDVPWDTSQQILTTLGCSLSNISQHQCMVVPPSWRNDLTREADLLEEIARIFGYDKIPENVNVPSIASAKRPKDYLLDRVRRICNASGLDESMTPSVVTDKLDSYGSNWTEQTALKTEVPLLKGATALRRSIVPSLLESFVWNQSQSISDMQLFETAVVYLPEESRNLPIERVMLGIVIQDADPASGIRRARGLFDEILLRATDSSKSKDGYPSGINASAGDCVLVQPGTGLRLIHQNQNNSLMGWIGLLDANTAKSMKIAGNCIIGEFDLTALLARFQSVPTLNPISPFPAVTRDLNFILEESVTWEQLSSTIRAESGELLKNLQYQETYRDAKKDGAGKKRMLLSLVLQSNSDTLSSDQVDNVIHKVVTACTSKLGGTLLG